MHEFALHKNEKLCSRTATQELFAHGHGVMAYPLRAVWRVAQPDQWRPNRAPVQFMVSIPKKKIRTAVGRVLLRRRTREAYRLNRKLLLPALQQAGGVLVDVSFIWLSHHEAPYAVVQEKMCEILAKIADQATRQQP